MKNETEQSKWLKVALILSVITIVYNLAEGLVSVWFGGTDDTLTLLGFGIDSFVEVISGIGILHMVRRMQSTAITEHDRFERQALRITGAAFYILTAGLLIGVVLNLWRNVQPETTFPGIIISVVSILTMFFLMKAKQKAGRILNSEAIKADAECTATCLYLSVILLVSSSLYYFFKIPYTDLAGSLGIAWFAYREGKEALEKASSKSFTCNCHKC